MEKKTAKVKVTRETYDLLTEIVKRNHADLTALHRGMRKASGDKLDGDEDSAAALNQDYSLQIILRKNKEELKNCVIIKKPKDNKKVQIGHRVRINLGQKEAEFVLDGLSVSKGVCSLSSPLGQAINGKKAGDKFDFNGKEGKILSIS